MSNPSSTSRGIAERNRLLALAVRGAGLADESTIAAAEAECLIVPGRLLLHALTARGGLSPAELSRLRTLDEAWTNPRTPGRARFHPLRCLHRGEQTEVWAAFDIDLDRLAAIKVLRDIGAEESRERLRREAVLTARIAHPAVVPIYATSTDTDGHPSHAMRLVAGETLQAAIRRLHGTPGSASAPDPSRRLLLLDSVIQACDALAAAHALGIVHRDVRTANLVREPDGTTFLLGWDHALAPEDPDPESVRLRGVPGFAAPELAEGGVVGASADIYGLGAIVYALWTGQVPDGADSVQAGDGRKVPRELAAICRRALARDPEQRYARVADLAADLRAWREDRTPPGVSRVVSASVLRPLRRNRVAAVLGAAALIALLVAGATIQVLSRRAADARAAIARERTAMQASAGQVVQVVRATASAVERLDDLAVDDTVPSDPRRASVHRQTAVIWRKLFEALQAALTPWLSTRDQLALASAILDTATQSNLAGAYEEGLTAADAAESIFRRFLADPEQGAHARMGCAVALRVRAYSLKVLRRVEEALASCDRALVLLDALRDESPRVAEYLTETAAVRVERARILRNLGRPVDMATVLDNAIVLCSQAVEIHSADPIHYARLATFRMQRGDLELQNGHLARARRDFEQSLADRQRLQQAYPQNPRYRRDVATSLWRLGHLERREGNPKLAGAHLEKAIDLLKEVSEAEPGVVSDTFQCTQLLLERAAIDRDARRLDAARNWLDQAMTSLAPLLNRVRDHPDLLMASSQILYARGEVVLLEQSLDAAITQHEQAVRELRRVLQSMPSHREAARRLSISLGRLAAIELRRNQNKTYDLDNALTHAEEADTLGQLLLKEQPSSADIQSMVVRNLLTFAEIQARGAVPAESYFTLCRCETVLKTQAPGLSDTDRSTFLSKLAAGFCRVAPALKATPTPGECEVALTRSLDHLETAAALGSLTADWLRRHPWLKPLHGNPRFLSLINDLNAPDSLPRSSTTRPASHPRGPTPLVR